MKRLFLALLLLTAATLLIRPLRERATPPAKAALSWTNERLEGPLSPVYNRYRRLKTESELSKIVNQLVILRNTGLTPPDDLETFIVRREASKTGTDGWGTPYIFERRGDSLYIRSAGQDLTAGTDDDLVEAVEYRDRRSPRTRPRGR